MSEGSYTVEVVKDGWVVRAPSGGVCNNHTHDSEESAQRHAHLCELILEDATEHREERAAIRSEGGDMEPEDGADQDAIERAAREVLAFPTTQRRDRIEIYEGMHTRYAELRDRVKEIWEGERHAE